ncbi:hypothetical protein BDV96DRAFT_599137 [Lophiotrema nucula]|uniref:Uncharacterized protein n=1 Tax=Lophiotrema nucula TaxID=690887 RepID=A0A6A5ZBJ0_9PLEO|nr:hypothetical protein BDV96DRAFT_599137 [Lophiotrema nucula]
MADRNSKLKPSEEEKEEKKRQAQIKREELLREWHNNTLSDDAVVKHRAEARLGLQIRLRESKSSRMEVREARDTCKEDGDQEGLANARKALKKHGQHYGHLLRLTKEGMPLKTEVKMRKVWLAESMSLERLLADVELDGVAEFQDPEQVDNVQKIKGEDAEDEMEDFWVSSPSPLGSTNWPQDTDQPAINEITWGRSENVDENLQMFNEEDKRIWQHHESLMRSRCRKANMAEHVIELKLAIQRKVFKQQAVHCHRVNIAYEELTKAISLGEQVPIGTQHPKKRLDTSEFTSAHGGLWRISSTALWAMYVGGESWDLPHWTPGGYMRVHTLSGLSFINIDFGHRSFSVDTIELPEFASKKTTAYTARCDKTGRTFGLEIMFIGKGYMRVIFPVHPILHGDKGCKILPWMDELVHFAATFEDPI